MGLFARRDKRTKAHTLKPGEEIRRACQHCGKEWFVTGRDIVAEHSALTRGAGVSRGLVEFGSALSGNGGGTALALRLERERASALATSRCPGCGSATFVQNLA